MNKLGIINTVWFQVLWHLSTWPASSRSRLTYLLGGLSQGEALASQDLEPQTRASISLSPGNSIKGYSRCFCLFIGKMLVQAGHARWARWQGLLCTSRCIRQDASHSLGAHRVQVCTQWWCSKLLHANACKYLFTQLKTKSTGSLIIIKIAIIFSLIVFLNHVKII